MDDQRQKQIQGHIWVNVKHTHSLILTHTHRSSCQGVESKLSPAVCWTGLQPTPLRPCCTPQYIRASAAPSSEETKQIYAALQTALLQ